MQTIELVTGEGGISGYIIDSHAVNLQNYLEGHTNLAKAICFRLKQRKETIALIKNLYVDEAHRGQGVGSALVSGFLEEADAAGATCTLLIADNGEEQLEGFNLQAWYEDFGFSSPLATSSGPLMATPGEVADDLADFLGAEVEQDDSPDYS